MVEIDAAAVCFLAVAADFVYSPDSVNTADKGHVPETAESVLQGIS